MAHRFCPHCAYPISQPFSFFGRTAGSSYCTRCNLPLNSQKTALSARLERVAPLFARCLARLIDYTLVGIFFVISDWLTRGAFFQGLRWFTLGIRDLPEVDYAIMLWGVLGLGYFIIFHTLTGQTLGKYCCHIIVMKEGRRLPGWGASCLRELGILFVFITGGWLFLIQLISAQQKGVQDMLSGTQVYAQESEE